MGAYHSVRSAWYELISTLPPPIERNLRRATATALGHLGSIGFRRSDLVPPLKLRVQCGLGNWTKVGAEFRDIFVRLGGLRRSDRVLDIGCGYGRMAVALADWLDPGGSYEGIDIFPEALDWCRTRITRKHPNFRFRLIDVRSDMYNPAGAADPESLRFPYPDGSFDFVFLTSVFTHMLPPAVGNYLREIGRVLAPGGRSVITFYLLNETSVALLASGKGEPRFPTVGGTHRFADPAHPEHAVSYDEGYVRGLYAKSGLEILEPIRWGYWCGRKEFLSLHDVVIAVKR